jgi:MFS family permease
LLTNISKFSSKMFLVMFLTVLVAQIVDAVLGGLADVLKDFTVSFWGVALFVGISLVYGFGQYSILGMVKSRNKEKQIRRKHFNVLENTVTIVQYVLLAALVLVILQVLVNSEYHTIILRFATVISYGLAAFLMGMLSYSLFSWFKENRALVVLLYGIAAAVIVVYVVAIALIFDITLQEKSAVIVPESETIFAFLVGFMMGRDQ